MDQQFSKLMNLLLILIAAWMGFSFLNRCHSWLPVVIVVVALINLVSMLVILEAPGSATKLCRRQPVRSYFGGLCFCMGRELPTVSNVSRRRNRVRLRKPSDFSESVQAAKQIVRGRPEVIEDAFAKLLDCQVLNKEKARAQQLPAAFLLVGIEGTGKQFFSRVVSKLMFGDGSVGIIDCKQLSNGDLLGSKDQPGVLARLLDENSARGILFENIEAADSGLVELLLAFLQNGKLQLSDSNHCSYDVGETLLFFSTAAISDALDVSLEVPVITHDRALEQLASEIGIDHRLIAAMHGIYSFTPPGELELAEVLAMKLKQECQCHDIELAYIEPAILAAQMSRLESGGFSSIPSLSTRLLRQPLVAVSSAGEKTLSLRVAGVKTFSTSKE